MAFFLSPFLDNGFMANALAAGLLVSVACGVVGTLVVLRGLAFIGDALGHGVLPGVAVALLLGLPGMVGAAAGAVLMILGITVITRKSSLSSDTAIGLLFVAMLALGVAIVSRSSSFSGDLVVGCDSEGRGGTVFEAPTFAIRPSQVAHGPFASRGGCVMLELQAVVVSVQTVP